MFGINPNKTTHLPKCYLCNQHFKGQIEFNFHMKEHQNKIDRECNKTSSSFRSTKKIKKIAPIAKKIELTEEFIQNKSMKENEEQEKKEYHDEYNDEFMTEIKEIKNKIAEKTYNEDEFIEAVENKKENIESLILKTHFKKKYMENFQLQLIYIKEVIEIAPENEKLLLKETMKSIKHKIFEEILTEVKEKYRKNENEIDKEVFETEIFVESEILYCGECYGEIKYNEEKIKFKCKHVYHKECYTSVSCCE